MCGPLLAVLIFALVGCGGSQDPAGTGSGTAAVDAGSEPNAVVVQVGDHPITRAQVAHALAGRIKFEQLDGAPPLPPDFTGCIQHLEKTSGTKPNRTALKGHCEAQYHELLSQAVDRMISDQWIIGWAAESGVHVNAAEAQAYLKQQEAGSSQAQVAATLATRDESLAEFAFGVKVNLLAEKIRHLLAARTEHLTAAQVAAYYDAHRSQFGTPPRRALYIARARSEAEALKVKREIVSGRSFASVVKGLPLEQPIFTKDGFLADYEPNLYSEPLLNNAIYAARPDVVAGPVRISLGYYVFEVKRLIPAVPEPFTQAQATIRAQLPNELYKQALRTFVARSRARWRSKTKCRPGYVVAKCAGAPLGFEDPYTLG